MAKGFNTSYRKNQIPFPSEENQTRSMAVAERERLIDEFKADHQFVVCEGWPGNLKIQEIECDRRYMESQGVPRNYKRSMNGVIGHTKEFAEVESCIKCKTGQEMAQKYKGKIEVKKKEKRVRF